MANQQSSKERCTTGTSMNTRTLLVAFLATTLFNAVAQNNEPAAVTSRISDVTVYADRARVSRSAQVTLHSGVTRLAFGKLPGWLDEGSIRVSLQPAAAAELLDVQVEKTYLARPEDQDIRKAEIAVLEIGDQIAALDDKSAALDDERKQIEAIRAFTIEKFPKDAATREIKTDEYSGVVKFIGTSVLDVAKSKRAIEKERRDLEPELRARQQKLEELRQRSQLEQRTVIVTLKSAKDGTANLSLNYLLPGATWEPLHELRTVQDGGSATMASYAVVTQTTGEDWDGVTLTFSTQRPTDVAKIPALEALLVGGSHTLAQVINPEADSFRRAQVYFDTQNNNYNTVVNTKDIQLDWGKNVDAQRARQHSAGETFRRVQQKRGTTAQFSTPAAQTVRSDGRTVRVAIGSASLGITPRIIAAPELSLNAVETADLANTSGQPLLPGKVLLFTEGAFTGTTETDFVAPGEKFSMFLGVADRLKLARTIDQKRSSVTWTGKRKRMLASFLVTAENLSDKPSVFQLADRVPVSETDEIKVIAVKLQPEAKPDVKGLVKWEVTLPPNGKKEFRIEYTVDYPADLRVAKHSRESESLFSGSKRKPVSVTDMPGMTAPAPVASPEPAGPMSQSSTIYDVIDSLEQSIQK
jgi:uncharacterized protein (TIGR02231 family)